MPIYYRLLFDNKDKQKSLKTHAKNAILKEENPIYSEMHYLVEAVEINSLLPIKDELTDMLEITERMQLIGFAMLYAGICPSVTLVVFVYSTFDSFFMRYCDCNF